MKSQHRMKVFLALIMSFVLLGCMSGQVLNLAGTPVPTQTPTATWTQIPSDTPTATKTPKPTNTPKPAILTDGASSWPVTSVTLEDNAPIGNTDKVPAGAGFVYLKITLGNPNHKMPSFPHAGGSKDTDYSQI
jgi:hypothetical protein